MISARKRQQAAEEGKSLAACQELKKFEESHSTMLRQYDELDAECVRLARELQPLLLAASPQADATLAKLRLKRAERDNVKVQWNRTRNHLAAACDNSTRKDIARFSETVLRWGQELFAQRKIAVMRTDRFADDTKKQAVLTNAALIAKATDELMQMRKRVAAMNMKPLAEVREAIAAATARYEELLDLVTGDGEEMTLPPSTVRELRTPDLRVKDPDRRGIQSIVPYSR